MTSKSPLTVQKLCDEAAAFAETESKCGEPGLYGVTDGKRVGTCLEHKFMDHLQSNYVFNKGNSASGIDIPDLGVDIKTTSIRQPQSSCPFESPHQKIYGLGYHLIIFVYAKSDNYEGTSKNRAKPSGGLLSHHEKVSCRGISRRPASFPMRGDGNFSRCP